MLLGLVVAVAMTSGTPAECADAPSRASSGYWTYIDNCGCSKLDPPSRASSDYDRYAKACASYRERNPAVKTFASPAPKECSDVPSRASASFWTYVDNCGCSKLDPPSRASSDYDRYAKACADWRARNPGTAATPKP